MQFPMMGEATRRRLHDLFPAGRRILPLAPQRQHQWDLVNFQVPARDPSPVEGYSPVEDDLALGDPDRHLAQSLDSFLQNLKNSLRIYRVLKIGRAHV